MDFFNVSWWTESQNEVFPLAFGIIIVVAIALGLLLKNKSEKIKNIPLLIITVLIIVAEIVKQVRAIEAGYGFWSIPLHYCSTFLIWFSMATFFKGKVKDAGQKISLLTGLAFLVGFIIGPSTIIGNATSNLTWSWSNFGNLHTFYYHFAVVLFVALQIAFKHPFPTIKDLKRIGIPFFSWMIVSAIVANLLNVNFSNLLYSNIGFMDSIRINYGYPIYLASMFIAFFSIFVGILLIGTLIDKIRKKFKKS
ncbi:MAG: hypothetical protein AB7S44_00020 [Spirochaetales bacterium]